MLWCYGGTLSFPFRESPRSGETSKNSNKWQSWRRAARSHLDLALGLHHLQFGLGQLLLQLPDLSFKGLILPFAALPWHFPLGALTVTWLNRPLALRRVGGSLVWICDESALRAKPHGFLTGGEKKKEEQEMNEKSELMGVIPSTSMLAFTSVGPMCKIWLGL